MSDTVDDPTVDDPVVSAAPRRYGHADRPVEQTVEMILNLLWETADIARRSADEIMARAEEKAGATIEEAEKRAAVVLSSAEERANALVVAAQHKTVQMHKQDEHESAIMIEDALRLEQQLQERTKEIRERAEALFPANVERLDLTRLP